MAEIVDKICKKSVDQIFKVCSDCTKRNMCSIVPMNDTCPIKSTNPQKLPIPEFEKKVANLKQKRIKLDKLISEYEAEIQRRKDLP